MKRFHTVKTLWFYTLASMVWLAGLTGGCAAKDSLYAGFAHPPMTARPMVRWWWVGNAVTKHEVLRELDVLKKAGIGGVEINPVAMPGGSRDIGAKQLTWLGPQWNAVLKTAVEGARRRGMTADLIVGSGWPFGGRFLTPAQRTKQLTYKTIALTGPREYRASLDDLLVPNRKPFRAYEKASPPRLQFLRLVPHDAQRIEQCVDLSGQVRQDGQVVLQIPPGRHTLYVGIVLEGFSKVTLGAPGADGPVLDHFNRAAVEKYLNRMSDALDPIFGGKMGNGLHAMFCDSIELSGANWTTDLPDQFRQRRGYDLEPYLPFVLLPRALPGDSALARAVRRVRYDYSKTLVELFHERFIRTFHQWCHQHGVLSRYQAYGSRMIGMLDAYLMPDIPEGDTWLFHGNNSVGPLLDGIRYAVWNKYASSGAHLTGRSIVSCESMTNLAGVFAASLNYIKQATDLNFITGINQNVLHGFTYSPPQAGFPGWIRYGTFFNEKNTWWPYMHHWTDYTARLSYVFQHSREISRVAILGPDADIWSASRLNRPAFINTPGYRHLLWQAIHQNGCGADYVSESVIQHSESRDGRLCFGPAAYDLLVILEADSLEPATAQALLRYARAGGRIALVGRVPTRSPGLQQAQANDAAVQQALQAARAVDAKRVAVIDPPETDRVRTWADKLLSTFGVRRDVTFSTTDDRLFQIHHRQGDRDLFFLCNLARDRAIDVNATFDTAGQTPWRWNPLTGGRAVYPQRGRPNELAIHLEPLESLLLVFEPDKPGPAQPLVRTDRQQGIVIPGPWRITCQPVGGQPFDMTLAQLVDFKDHPRLKSFAGVVTYRTTFNADDTTADVLSLGAVEGVTEITLNGKALGVRWWGRHEYDLSGALKTGTNHLTIKLTTTLRNYVRTLKDSPVARQWTGRSRQRQLDSVGVRGPVQRFRRTRP